MWKYPSLHRATPTALECRECGRNLILNRGCREVSLYCRSCGSVYPLADYIDQIDEEMEEFLSSSFCDRL